MIEPSLPGMRSIGDSHGAGPAFVARTSPHAHASARSMPAPKHVSHGSSNVVRMPGTNSHVTHTNLRPWHEGQIIE